MRRITTTYDIQSLSPAPGWVCVYAEEEIDGSVTVNVRPLVGWAICRTAGCDNNGVQLTPAGRVKWDEFKVTVPAIFGYTDEVRVVNDLFDEHPGDDGEITPYRVVQECQIEIADAEVRNELKRRNKRSEAA